MGPSGDFGMNNFREQPFTPCVVVVVVKETYKIFPFMKSYLQTI